ncbi:MAG TPA: alkaline phosphatase family protein [Terracidiphilus sp.]|nr:alkaline phosphatase family protein [Terracidiphilus sp.]
MLAPVGCASIHTPPGPPPPVSGTGPGTQGIAALNHIIFEAQENRSFDNYFGALRQYWAQNGYADKSFDGLAQFNPASGAAPLYGPAPSNPGCDPGSPAPGPCIFDPDNPVSSFHFQSECGSDPATGWNVEHHDWDYYDLVGLRPAELNGFVVEAANESRTNATLIHDDGGLRPMGYFDGDDLNYYYFMASNFATSDRWFQPVMSDTPPNRAYLIAATSQGYVNGNAFWNGQFLTAPTIFQELQAAGISWKIYVNPGAQCSGPPYDPACLVSLSYIRAFAWSQTVPSKYPQNIAPLSQYFIDVQNGTLPQVAEIEVAPGDDEHPPENVQVGALYDSKLINALMQSQSWKDSAFILTFDESGGYYDHVSPQPEPSPDGIKPVDLTSVCTQTTGPTCDFVYSGYRVPLIAISPFAKKHYVSHTVTDSTAIVKLIETRFNLQPLTKRDAAQMDMTEFFDFADPPWTTPPSPPAQNMGGACYLDHVP